MGRQACGIRMAALSRTVAKAMGGRTAGQRGVRGLASEKKVRIGCSSGFWGILDRRYLWRRLDEPKRGPCYTGCQRDVFWEAPSKHNQLHERLLRRRTYRERIE